MPNIVEQQDLLKGLPDTRLALLMQNPVATIPPFLVAAEAQRRQAIRQQRAGSGDNESVVDSLTRQLASVPQNIRATPQPMPQVPQTPPMMGVAALQQAQQAQQGMANGGPVRRFAEQGYVAPTLTNPFDYIRSTYPAGQFPGSISEAYGGISNAASQAWNSQTAKDAFDTMRVGAGRAIDLITLNPYNAQILGLDPVSVEENRKLMDENAIKANNPMAGQGASEEDSYRRAISDMEKLAGRKTEAAKPPDPNAGKAGTSTENQTAAEDELRNRLEALYADEGASDMEKAQKWFAMASQFYDPKLTTGQSIARAGLAFTEAAGNQAQAEREALRAREEALLKYDIGKQEAERAAAAAERERTSMSAKDKATVLNSRLGSLDDMISQERKNFEALKENVMNATPEKIAAAEKQISDLLRVRDAVAGELSALMEQAYGPTKFDTFSFSTGFQR